MSEDDGVQMGEMRYDHMVERALLGVVREALEYVNENGLPGEHHFYITFQTSHPGVEIPDHLRARYPGEMTIILQYQFWDLEIGDKEFSITLSFSDVAERLTVPYESIVAFADPSVRFGLQFDVSRMNEEEEEALESLLDEEDRQANDGTEETAEAGEEEEENNSAKVVTLDSFRKK
ncbi:SspB family protein [Kiloniella sp. b19]|uniref:SspB family protein n=1 Tax=Kiloniella sp. GXU_MW_B19 TaxID=3141326 RepID=UPI0031D617E8